MDGYRLLIAHGYFTPTCFGLQYTSMNQSPLGIVNIVGTSLILETLETESLLTLHLFKTELNEDLCLF